MRYTLKDYQADAVRDVLANLADARKRFHILGDRSQFALTATTGAGKTVMAAAAIEALFYGDEEFDVAPDPSAVVLWFSDDPNLNEQTRFRLMAASDKLKHSDLVTIQHPFSLEKLRPGKVYFLNTGKLTKTSLLTRGHDQGDESTQLPGLRELAAPDLQGYTVWDTLANTIEDPDLTLVMVQDEAHRGFGTKATRDKSTIVRRLIDGHAHVPAMPIVWGISATVQRFEAAMDEAKLTGHRFPLPRVSVDPARVQESGLLKDTIALDIPAETGSFDTVLLARATRKAVESTRAWAAYAASQPADAAGSASDPVVPLMVLQVPNTPDEELYVRALDTIFEQWPGLSEDAVAHVLGDHSIQQWGPYQVRYVAPERVQDTTEVRVLIAKEAISTGWDCPRAEVLVSFRPAKDAVHITQLLGRMVRTPLAMRIPGNEKLNAVECLLPHFDRKTAQTVVSVLTAGSEDFPDSGGERKVLIDPQEFGPNPHLSETVWEALEAIPSQSLPRKGAKPVKRLLALAHALATDGIRPDAGKQALAELCAVLDGCAARYRTEVDQAVADVWTVEGETVVGTYGAASTSIERFTAAADDRAIMAAFRDAGRVLTQAVAGAYVDRLAGPEDPNTDDDGLRDAHATTAALALVRQIREDLDREADALTTKWFDEHRVAILDVSDERLAAYNEIRAMSTDPQRMTISRPKNVIAETKRPGRDGDEPEPVPTQRLHLLSDGQGDFPVGDLNDWELNVLHAEMERPGAVAWYRNPARSAQEAVSVAYQDGTGDWRTMRPDFVFFDTAPGSDTVRVSLVDPHSHHLADALPKLRGLARFAAEYGDEFHRIEALTQLEGKPRVLNMKDESVRDAAEKATSAQALYESVWAQNY